jgi:hypothetical protein
MPPEATNSRGRQCPGRYSRWLGRFWVIAEVRRRFEGILPAGVQVTAQVSPVVRH